MKKYFSIFFALLILATASPTNQGIETILRTEWEYHLAVGELMKYTN